MLSTSFPTSSHACTSYAAFATVWTVLVRTVPVRTVGGADSLTDSLTDDGTKALTECFSGSLVGDVLYALPA